jgi:DNA-binding NarL/FixJ family response regulator
VKNHLSNAMRKLSLHDRTHAVVFAVGAGWIRLPDLGVPEPA